MEMALRNLRTEDKMMLSKDESTTDDALLVEQSKAGNYEAFGILYSKYWKLIYCKAYSMLRNHELAEDTLQDIFLKVWRKLNKWDPHSGMFKSWLYEVARNTIIDVIRRQNRNKEVLLSEGEYEKKITMYAHPMKNPAQQFEAKETFQIFRQALTEVSNQNHQKAWALRHLHDLSIKEIAQILRRKENTIKIWIFRCTKELRQILQRRGIYEFG